MRGRGYLLTVMDQINLFQDGVTEGASADAKNAFVNNLTQETEQQDEEILAKHEPAPVEAPASPSPEAAPAANVGTERDLGQIIEGAGLQQDLIPGVTGFIDNALGTDLTGFYEQRQEDTAEQREAIAAGAEEFRKNQPEAVKVVTGAVAGIGETALGAGEVLGDTVKTFATLGNVRESDNPFSSNYDWATWNLGKDEYGAQTGIGKTVQGITEFAGTMALTGGFGGGGTTLAGQVVRGGVKGMAADALSAVSGDGNMSNMLEESFPELKDTWLTALAIDKEDNVFSAATKTALEGFGAGAAIETGVRMAWRGAKGLLKGKPAAEVAAEAAPAVDRNPNLAKVSSQILESGDTARFERFSQIQDMEAAGIPTTWDDAAAVVPEYFLSAAPGLRREIMPDFAQATYDRLDEMVEQGLDGVTIDPFTGEVPVSGNMVAIDGAVLEDLSDPDAVAAFISKNQDVFTREDVYLGARVNENTGKAEVELSRLVEDADEAEMLGRLFDQKGVYRLDDAETIAIGGSDALRQTKGQHLQSAYTTPVEPTITPPAKVAAQQIEAATSLAKPANGGGGGRLATNAQVKQIADARGEGAGEAIDSLIKSAEVDETALAKEARLTVSSLRSIVENDLANFLDVDGKLIQDAFSTIKYGDETILSRQGAFQVRAMMANTASAIYDAAFKVSKTAQEGIPSDMHIAQMKDNLLALLKMHKHTSNLIGTRLADYSINVGDMNLTMEGFMKAADPRKLDETIEAATKELENMVKGVESGDPKALQQAQRTASMLQLTAGDVTKMVDVSKNMKELGTEAALKLMYNSMLSSPTTHLVNNLSNAFNMVYRPLTMAAGGNAKQKKAAIASYHNFFKTIPEAFELAIRTAKTGVSNVGGTRDMVENSVTEASLRELARKADESDNDLLKAGSFLLHMLHDVANFPLFDWPSRFLTTSDEFFKVMVTRMEYNRISMEKAIDLAGAEGESAVEETFKRLLKSEYSRNFTKSGGVLNDDLLKGAKEVTFQTELEGPAAKFASFLNDVPALRIFFPFVKTGHNVLVYTGTHVPLLNMALKESRDVIAQNTVEGAIMRGRLAFGTMSILGAATLAATGQITGNGPAGGQRRKEWLKTHQPRSFRVGDRWVSYDRIEPFGQIFSAVADIQYAVESGDMEEDRGKYLAGYLSHALGVNLTDKSMFQGLEPLSGLLNSRNFSPESFLAMGLETGNNFIPLAGARRALTNALHPYMQEFNEQYDRALHSATFGIAGNTANKIDWLDGSTITSGSGGFGNSILPMKTVKRGQDPVRDALEDIEFDTSVISEELGGVELDPQQKAQFATFISETGIYDDLKAWVTKPNFKVAVADYQEKVRNGHRVKKEDQYFYRQITNKLRAAKKVAVYRLKQEYPDLNAEMMMDKYAAQADRLPNGYESLINFGNQ